VHNFGSYQTVIHETDLVVEWLHFFEAAINILDQYKDILHSSNDSSRELVQIPLENLVVALQQSLPSLTGDNRIFVEEIIRNVCVLNRHLKTTGTSGCTNLAIYCWDTPPAIVSLFINNRVRLSILITPLAPPHRFLISSRIHILTTSSTLWFWSFVAILKRK